MELELGSGFFCNTQGWSVVKKKDDYTEKSLINPKDILLILKETTTATTERNTHIRMSCTIYKLFISLHYLFPDVCLKDIECLHIMSLFHWYS